MPEKVFKHPSLQPYYENSSAIINNIYRVTFASGKSALILGTQHNLPISALSKRVIEEVDECDYFFGEEGENTEEDMERLSKESLTACFRKKEGDTWFEDLSPLCRDALIYLWPHVTKGRFREGCVPDLSDINSIFVENFIHESVAHEIMEAVGLEIPPKHIEACKNGMDLLLPGAVFGQSIAEGFDRYFEREMRNFRTDVLPAEDDDDDDLVETLCVMVARKYGMSLILSEAELSERKEALKKMLTKEMYKEIISWGSSYFSSMHNDGASIDIILSNEKEDEEENYSDVKNCNIKWSSQLHEVISSRDGLGLIAVGVGHLFGEYGMLTILERMPGCQVEINASEGGWQPWVNRYKVEIARREGIASQGADTLEQFKSSVENPCHGAPASVAQLPNVAEASDLAKGATVTSIQSP